VAMMMETDGGSPTRLETRTKESTF
jgi:hypothetical protein